MIDLLTKPANLITIQDVQSLIDQEVPENEQVEYKREIPAGGNEQWIKNSSLTKKAKEAILKEAVGFANAYGGILLLGIDESKTSPPIAERVSPISCCNELAERLSLIFRDLVEPQLTRLEVFAVVTNNDDGVIVVRVGGRSRLSPHRVMGIRVCPIRRQDRCEEMTMREIQDMTLNVSRGLERVDKLFAKRAKKLDDELENVFYSSNSLGLRATAVPLDDAISFDYVFQSRRIVPELKVNWQKVTQIRRDGTESKVEVPPLREMIFWRPLLRAARADSDSYFLNRLTRPEQKPDTLWYKEVHHDGLVEFGFIDSFSSPEVKAYLNPNVVIVLLANLLVQVEKVKQQAGSPTLEYAIEIQLTAKTPVVIGRPSPQFRDVANVDPGTVTFPRYPFADLAKASDLLNLAQRDFFNMLEEDIDNREIVWRFEDHRQ